MPVSGRLLPDWISQTTGSLLGPKPPLGATRDSACNRPGADISAMIDARTSQADSVPALPDEMQSNWC